MDHMDEICPYVSKWKNGSCSSFYLTTGEKTHILHRSILIKLRIIVHFSRHIGDFFVCSCFPDFSFPLLTTLWMWKHCSLRQSWPSALSSISAQSAQLHVTVSWSTRCPLRLDWSPTWDSKYCDYVKHLSLCLFFSQDKMNSLLLSGSSFYSPLAQKGCCGHYIQSGHRLWILRTQICLIEFPVSSSPSHQSRDNSLIHISAGPLLGPVKGAVDLLFAGRICHNQLHEPC